MNDTDIALVAARFEGSAGYEGYEQARRAGDAAVAAVFMLDGRWVLRGRAFHADSTARFEREADLLDKAREVLPWALPEPVTTADGGRYVVEGGYLWTMHRALPGEVFCPWRGLHAIGEGHQRRLVRTLLRMHELTRGKLPDMDADFLAVDAARRLKEVRRLLPDATAARVEAAIGRVAEAAAALPPSQRAFVHGDFHYGNILLDDDGRVTALLDLDWCRVGNPVEDLAYTAMMLLRDYETGTIDWPLLDRVVRWYELDPASWPLFHECLIVYAMFDVHLLSEAASLEGRDDYIAFQKAMLEALVRAGPA